MSCSVQKVRPGVFRARVYVGTVDGKERTRSRTFEAANMREAKQLAARHESDIRNGVKIEVDKSGTVEELVDLWLAHSRGAMRSPTTMLRMVLICQRINEHLGHIRATDLKARDVDAFYASLRMIVVKRATKDEPARHLSESTVHHYHRILRAILRYGVRHDVVPVAVTEKAETPKPIRYEAQILPDETMRELFATAPASIQLAITCEALMGLRRGELFGLQWRDVQGDVAVISRNTVVVGPEIVDRVTKGKRSRRVPIVPDLARALAGLRVEQEAEAAKHGVVLAPAARVMADQSADPTGRTPHSPLWLSGEWTRHAKRRGHHVRLHDLRHWCASQMLTDGVPVNVVQEILGHASAMTTMSVYAHVISGSMDVARASLAGRGGLLGLTTDGQNAGQVDGRSAR
jgi:integrase